MWNFSRYTSGVQAFSLSRDSAEVAGASVGVGARAGARAQAPRIVLRIFYKLSSEYLGILVAMLGATVTGSFVPEGPAGCLDNLSPDSV